VRLDPAARGELAGVVVTVMTNYGFHRAMADDGIEVAVTQVGDRYVIDEMLRREWKLGGEQSGHIIATDIVATGDGTAAALLMIVYSGTFSGLLAAIAFFFVFDYTLVFLSVFVLRFREPEAARPYRAWGYPVTTGLALLGSIAFLAGAVKADMKNSIFALKLLGASLPVFLLLWLWRRAHESRER